MMKRHLIIASGILCTTMSAFALTKTDAGTQLILDAYRAKQLNPAAKVITPLNAPFDFESTSRADASTSAIVKLSDGATFDDLKKAGLEVVSTAGDDMAVVIGNIDDIIAMDSNAAVQSFSLSTLVKPMLNEARKLNGVATIHSGDGLPQAYKGEGVICGIFDTGIDPNHISFFNDDLSETRIKTFYHYYSSNGLSTAYDTPSKIGGFTTDNTGQSHGTHTLGCMTGSFNGTGGRTAIMTSAGGVQVRSTIKNPYYGMAPKADIVAGAGSLYNTNICGAVSKIVDYAKAHNQPAVINLSIGSTRGPHDGSSTVGQYMERLGKDAIICIAAGNDGDLNICLSKKFTTSDNTLKTLFDVASSRNSANFEIWSADSKKFSIKIVLYNTTTNKIVEEFAISTNSIIATNNYSEPTYIKSDNFDEAYTNSYVNCSLSENKTTNNRYSASIDLSLTSNSTTNADRHLITGIIIEGVDGGSVQCVLNNVANGFELSSLDQSGWSDGTNDFTINDMACGKNVIAVGAYNDRAGFPALSGGIYSYSDPSLNIPGAMSSYTSFGTLANGTNLPHVCSPGTSIISSYSKYYVEAGYVDTDHLSAEYTDAKRGSRKSYWNADTGTSMATPILAGALALWLQADPKLTVDKVLEIIQETAVKDEQTATTGNPIQWGAGKFNALAGLKKVLDGLGVNDIRVDNQGIVITPTGEKTYEIAVPGANNFNVSIVAMTGAVVRNINTDGDTYTLDLNDLQNGVYILNVNNGLYAQRILVR